MILRTITTTLLLFASYSTIAEAFTVMRPTRHQSNTIRKSKTTTTTYLSSSSNNNNEDAATSTISGVTLKLAFDSQWSVADLSSEKSERFTSEESLDMVHRLRRCSDAVLVGRSTVEIDDCSLTVRRVPMLTADQTQPIRAIIDSQNRLKLATFQIGTDGLRTIILHDTNAATPNDKERYPNVTFVGLSALETTQNSRLLSSRDVTDILKSQHGIDHLMVEGGPQTAISFLEEGVVDRAILVHAPLKFIEPFESKMSEATLENAGLECLGEYESGVDRISCWSRPGLDWPASPLSAWP